LLTIATAQIADGTAHRRIDCVPVQEHLVRC
jgi:hypothetical protein